MHDKNEGMYRGGEGKTPVTTSCCPKVAEDTTSYELSWIIKMMIKKKHTINVKEAYEVPSAAGPAPPR